MALFYKFQEGGETPKYSLYGEEYNFNDLERRVYNDFDDFISTTKYGKKNRDGVYSAVLNIMNGLKSGRVTFENGSFIDSKGEYHNERKEKNDVYGIAAAWILKNMNLTERITPPTPESKDKYSSSIMGKYILNTIFNNESPSNEQLLDFLDSDDWLDEDHKSKNNTRRIDILRTAISDALSNFDNIINLYDISDEEKIKLKLYIEQALRALEDNKLDDNEYLALSKAFGGINWRNMMSTDFSTTSEGELQEDEDKVPEGFQEIEIDDNRVMRYPVGTDEETLLDEYIRYKYGEAEDGEINPIYKVELNKDLLNQIQSGLERFSPEEVISDLNSYHAGDTNENNIVIRLRRLLKKNNVDGRNALLHIATYLIKKGRATLWHDNKYILNGVTDPNNPDRVLVVNKDNNNNYTYLWIAKINDPSFRDTARKELKRLNSRITVHKKGGSLKFDGGGRVVKGQNDLVIPKGYIENFWDNFGENSKYVNWDLENRILNYLEDNELKHKERKKGPTNKNVNNEYDIEPGGTETEKQEWWKYWEDVLSKNEKVAEAWARGYRELERSNTKNPTNHYSSWFNNDDTFNFTAFKDYTDPVTDKGHKLWNDNHNGIGHDFFTGKIFYILDGDNKYYYSLIPEGWSESDTINDKGLIKEILLTLNPIAESPAEEAPVEPAKEKKPEGPKSLVDPHDATLKGQGFDWTNLGRTLLPEGLAIGRLAGTIATNNRVFKTLNRSLRPYIKNTYELYSPVTGAFGLMLAYNLLAAALNRLADRNATSDASLNTASRLYANMLANLLLEKGFLADNLEILRTSQEALKRQEDNVARRTETANANRKSINDTVRERGLLRATRDQSNWNAIDEYLGGIEKRLRTKGQEREASYKQLVEDVAKLLAQNEFDAEMAPYKEELRAWYKEHPGESAATNWKNYTAYQEAYKNASIKQANTVYKALAKLYGYKYDPNTYSISGKKGTKLIKRKR